MVAVVDSALKLDRLQVYLQRLRLNPRGADLWVDADGAVHGRVLDAEVSSSFEPIHTPEGEDVQIFLGNAFDLVGERTQTNFNMIANNVIEETFEIRLRNWKDDQTVEIRVPETLYRWSNWEIVNSSDPFTKTDSNSIEFRVPVEPGQERVITYTVRYTFPN